MLTDAVEIEIISKAEQKNVRDPKRSRAHFEHIFEDFFYNLDFKDQRVLDLGPGQYDLGVMIRERGGDTWAIDKDPAVIELGRYKGFAALKKDLKALSPNWFDHPFDGVFCKYSIDAFWFPDAAEQEHFVCNLDRLLQSDGWAWIAPWNGGHQAIFSDDKIRMILGTQRRQFEACGFQTLELSLGASKYYGVHGKTINRPVFVKNLPIGRAMGQEDGRGIPG
jgi:hypothetical protein